MKIQTMKRIPLELINNNKIIQEYRKEFNNKINSRLYNKYLRIIVRTIIDFVLEGGYLNLPYNLGSLYIKRKIRKSVLGPNGEIRVKYIDWQKTYKLRKEKYPEYTKEDWKNEKDKTKCLVLYNNGFVSEFQYRINFKANRKYKLMKYFYFRPVRDFSREIAKYMKTKTKLGNYYE